MSTTQRVSHDDRGFTLIELMIVVGILGILMSIAVPTFLRAREPAQNKQAESLLRYGITASRVVYTDTGTYLGVSNTDLAAAEGSVAWRNGSTSAFTGNREVSVRSGALGSETFVILATRSASGDCLAALHPDVAASKYQKVVKPATCAANDFDPSTGWSDNWP